MNADRFVTREIEPGVNTQAVGAKIEQQSAGIVELVCQETSSVSESAT